MADDLGFSYRWDERTRQYAHPVVLFAISARGEVIDYFYGLRHDPAEIRARLLRGTARAPRPAPAAQGATRLGQAILECFRFEGAASRYWPVIQSSFRAGALAVFGALSLGLFVLFRRGRQSRE